MANVCPHPRVLARPLTRLQCVQPFWGCRRGSYGNFLSDLAVIGDFAERVYKAKEADNLQRAAAFKVLSRASLNLAQLSSNVFKCFVSFN